MTFVFISLYFLPAPVKAGSWPKCMLLKTLYFFPGNLVAQRLWRTAAVVFGHVAGVRHPAGWMRDSTPAKCCGGAKKE